MIGGLGIVEAQGVGLPAIGVEYVLATPQGRAVLRPLRYPFYDTDEWDNGDTADIQLFTNHRQRTDNTNKNGCDINMTLDSQLGWPNLYDLVGFTHELVYGVDQASFNDIYENVTFRWIFGQNTVFTRVTLKKIPQGIGPYGFNSTGTIMTQGLPVLGNFFNFTTPDRKARRIDSVEQFRNELHLCRALMIKKVAA